MRLQEPEVCVLKNAVHDSSDGGGLKAIKFALELGGKMFRGRPREEGERNQTVCSMTFSCDKPARCWALPTSLSRFTLST
jgi:hypothetical protein